MPKKPKPVELTDKEQWAKITAESLTEYPARWRWLARIAYFFQDIGRARRRRKLDKEIAAMTPEERKQYSLMNFGYKMRDRQNRPKKLFE